MASNRKYKWDRLGVEDDLDYTHFLIFRNLGPRRTLRKAYRHYLTTFANSQNKVTDCTGANMPQRWRNLYRDNRWVERASAWDVSNLKSVGSQLVVNQSRALLNLSRKALAASIEVAISTDDVKELLEVLKTIQQYLTPEFVGSTGQDANAVVDQPVAATTDSVE
jgi:hypothetical protein